MAHCRDMAHIKASSHQGIVAQVTLNIGANSGQGDEGAGMRINT
jgi:hypothetical protein